MTPASPRVSVTLGSDGGAGEGAADHLNRLARWGPFADPIDLAGEDHLVVVLDHRTRVACCAAASRSNPGDSPGKIADAST